jgi:hypothetical protein
MGPFRPIFDALEQRRFKRVSWAFNHEITLYARTLARVERPVGVVGGDPSTPMPQRAAEELPRLRKDRAKWRRACRELDEAREVVLRRLGDRKTPPAAAAAARRRFDPLDARHPTPDDIAKSEAQWAMSIARLERWVEREPEYAAR